MNDNFPFDFFINTDEALVHIDKSDTHRRFMLLRASAIEQYALYEHFLADLYATLKGQPIEVIGEDFFKINSALTRLELISKTFKYAYRNKYDKFWLSFFEYLKKLAPRRNMIVHWTTAKHMSSGGIDFDGVFFPGNSWTTLRPMSHWDKAFFGRELIDTDLMQFAMASHLFGHILMHLRFELNPSGRIVDPKWQTIFAAEFELPIPKEHPLFHYLQSAVNARMGLLTY